jgi:hypothetical protein
MATPKLFRRVWNIHTNKPKRKEREEGRSFYHCRAVSEKQIAFIVTVAASSPAFWPQRINWMHMRLFSGLERDAQR